MHIHAMNTGYTLGNPIWEKSNQKLRTTHFSFILKICNVFPLTLFHEWMLQDILIPLLCSNIHPLSLAQLWNNTQIQ